MEGSKFIEKPEFTPEIIPRSEAGKRWYREFLNVANFRAEHPEYTPVSTWVRAIAQEVSLIDYFDDDTGPYLPELSEVNIDSAMPLAIASRQGITRTETLAATTTPLEAIRASTGCYFCGGDPVATSFERHTLKTPDMIHLLELLGDDDCICLTDRPHHHLVLGRTAHRKKRWTTTHDDEEATPTQLQKAKEESTLYAERDRCFLEAIQDWLGTQNPNYKRKRIHLTSEILDGNEEFETLLEKVINLYESSDKIQATILNCIPANARVYFEEDPYYTLYEITIILFLGIKKKGHKKEHPYDNAAMYLLKNHREPLGIPTERNPRFEYPNIPKTTGVIPYRVIALHKHNPETEPSLSMKQPIEWDGIQRTIHATVIPIFGFFMERIRRSENERLIRVEAMKIVHQIILELRALPQMRYLLLASGILDPRDELRMPRTPGKNDLPYKCRKNEKKVPAWDTENSRRHTVTLQIPNQESEEGHLIRYLGELIQGIFGPAYLHTSQLESQTGFLLWGFLNELYSTLEGRYFAPQTNIGFDQMMWGYEKWLINTFQPRSDRFDPEYHDWNQATSSTITPNTQPPAKLRTSPPLS
jgi:hypothetical protein